MLQYFVIFMLIALLFGENSSLVLSDMIDSSTASRILDKQPLTSRPIESANDYDKQIKLLRDKISDSKSKMTSIDAERQILATDSTDSAVLSYKMSQATDWLQLALALQAKDMRYHSGGLIQTEALTAFNNALSFSEGVSTPRFLIQANYYKGLLLKTMGYSNQSLECYDIAIDLATHPNDLSNAYYSKADLLSMIGNLTEALELYRRALELNPSRISIYYPITTIYNELPSHTTADWQALLDEMISHKARIDTHGDQHHVQSHAGAVLPVEQNPIASEIYWAMYLVAEKIGLIDDAWSYLSTAHEIELSKRQDSFNPTEAKNQLDHIKSIFQPSIWVNGVSHDSDVPIFIVGMMRSGSTLLETMLDVHPEIWGMGEDSIFNVNLQAFRDDVVNAFADRSSGGMKNLRSVVNKHGQYVQTRMIDKAKNHSSSSDSVSKKDGVRHVVDKMLFNYRNIGFIHLMYPNAVIIHTMRDPMDTLFSCWKHKFDDYGLSWSLSEAYLTLQYAIYLETMHHFRQVLPGRIIDVRYEELIANPRKVLGKVVDRIGVEWDEDMLEFYNSKRTVHTHSQSQVRHKLSSKSIGSWRKYAKHLAPMIKLMKSHLKDLRMKDALPYAKDINWDLDPTFNYTVSSTQDKKPATKKKSKTSRSKPVANDALTIRSTSQEQPAVIGELGHVTANKGDVLRVDANGDIKRYATSWSSSPKSDVHDKGKSLSHCQKVQQSYIHHLDSLYGSNQVQNKSYDLRPVSSNQLELGEQEVLSLTERKKLQDLMSFASGYSRQTLATNRKDSDHMISLIAKLLDMIYVFLPPCPVTSSKKSNRYVGYHSKKLADHIVDHINKQIKLISSDQYVDIEGLQSLWYTLGMIYSKTQQHDMAMKALDTLLIINIDHQDGRRKRLEIASTMKKHHIIIEDATYLLEASSSNFFMNSSSPSSSDLLLARGSSYYQSRRFIFAHSDFISALNLTYASSGQSFRNIASIREVDDLPCSQAISLLWNVIGKCEKEFGEWMFAYQSQAQALKCNVNMKEAHHDQAVALIEASYWEEAMIHLDRAIELDRLFKNPHGYKALLYHGLGRAAMAVNVLDQVLAIDPLDLQAQYLKASYLQTLGKYNDSILAFDKLVDQLQEKMWIASLQGLPVDDDIQNRYITAWFKREVVAFQWIHLDDDLQSGYNIENIIHPRTKEGHTSQISDKPVLDVIRDELEKISYRQILFSSLSERLKMNPHADMSLSNDINTCEDSMKECCSLACAIQPDDLQILIHDTTRIGLWIQLKTPGFLPNDRQHRMFGLAVLEIAQALQQLMYYHDHAIVSDAVSSKVGYVGFVPSAVDGYHVFGWRDLFDVAIRWRQVSEANDVVWWIDRIVSPKDQRQALSSSPDISSTDQRVGLNTNMVHGVGKVVRYYPYFNQSFTVTKEHLLQGIAYDAKESYLRLDDQAKAKVTKAKDLKMLYKAVYSKPFFVIPRIESLLHPGRYLNGTRITLMPSLGLPEGFDFSICSASTMDRFIQYEEEIDHAFKLYLNTLESILHLSVSSDARGSMMLDTLLGQSLTIFYYWVNYAPVTRGTSATGYAALYGCILAAGYEIESSLPEGVQLDWEAILSSTPASFIDHVKPWFHLIPLHDEMDNYLTPSEDGDANQLMAHDCPSKQDVRSPYCESYRTRINQVFRSARTMLQAINGVY